MRHEIKRKIGLILMFGGFFYFFYNLSLMSPLLFVGFIISLIGYLMMESR